MKASALRRWMFRLLLALGLAIGIGYLPYRLFGPGGVARALKLSGQLTSLTQDNEQLRQENDALRRRIRALKEDRSVIEQVARDELGMVRPWDIVFQFGER